MLTIQSLLDVLHNKAIDTRNNNPVILFMKDKAIYK